MRIVVFLAILAWPFAAAAQDLPTRSELSDLVGGQLPSFWTLLEYRTVAEASTGDPISPKALVRFEADVAPAADLFAATGDSIGPFDIVLRTMPAQSRRTLFGTVELTYRAGKWSGAPKIENPIDGLGLPIDMFDRPTLELGSDRQAEVMAMIRDNAISAARAELSAKLQDLSTSQEARIAALTAEHDAELARLQREFDARRAELERELVSATAEMDRTLASRKADLDRQLKDLENRQQARLADARARYDAQLAELKRQKAPEIARLQSELDRALDDARAANTAALQALAAKQEEQIAGMKQAHARTIGDLKARQAEEVARLTTGLAEKRKRLQAQLRDAADIIAMQAQMIAKLRTIRENDSTARELAAKRRVDRKAWLKSLGSELRGALSCVKARNGREMASHVVGFKVQQVAAAGLQGEFQVAGKQLPASLNLVGAANSPQRKFSLILQLDDRTQFRMNIAKSYDLVLDDVRAFSGTGKMLASDGPVNCRISLSN